VDCREELIRAAKQGESGVVAELIDADPSLVNCRDGNGWTPLCHAALNGHTDVVRLLLGRGGDAHLNQPIHYAGQRQHKEICRLLVDAGAVDHLVNPDAPNTVAVVRAVYRYDAEALASLLEKQPDFVRLRQVDGSTMLHAAATNGAIDVVRVLVEAGAELDAANDRGQTPLNRALSHSQTEVGRFLIESGAACDVTTTVQCGAAQRVAQMLETDASLLAAKDPEGRSLLQLAMMFGQKEVVSVLLDRGIDDPKGLGRKFRDGIVFENDSLAGTLFKNVNLRGSVFQDVNLRDSVFYYLDLGNVSIDYANISGLRIFGIEIEPLVQAERARKSSG
jgi:ankyrin repeat protein